MSLGLCQASGFSSSASADRAASLLSQTRLLRRPWNATRACKDLPAMDPYLADRHALACINALDVSLAFFASSSCVNPFPSRSVLSRRPSLLALILAIG